VTALAQSARAGLPVAGAAVLAVVVGAELVRQPSLTRLIAAGCIAACALVAAAQWPRQTAVVTVLALPFLALGRRLLLEFAVWESTDPLLLVAPAVLGVILIRLFMLEQQRLADDRVSKLVVLVIALSFVQVANPRGGGLAAGAAALLFTAVPLAWFFVGRELMTPRTMRTLFGGLVVTACVVAVYGLRQTWEGLPTWDEEWVRQSGYAALRIGDVIRAFGTFSSSAEYASYLGIGLVVALAFALERHSQFLPAIPVLAVALFYASARAVIVATAFAAIVVLAARMGNMRRAVAALVVCVAGLALALTFAKGVLQEEASSSSDALVSHQLGGLADPFNEETSTLPQHLAMFTNGLKAGVDPIGHGIASTTLAGDELGGQSRSTEVDISNAFVSLGGIGGVAYLALVLLVLYRTLQLAVHDRSAVSLAALGALVVVLGQWLNGGFHAVSPLVWLTVGFVVACDRARD
jgi:hypothetical protein